MICCSSKNITAWEDDSTQSEWLNPDPCFWVYCNDCDVWTSHPLVKVNQ